jgi:enoyl-CoA hydratase
VTAVDGGMTGGIAGGPTDGAAAVGAVDPYEFRSEDAPAGELRALRVTRRGPVAQVNLVGPGKGNAMGPDFWREVPVVFAALDTDPDIHAVVVTGSGRDFCYGLDLTTMFGGNAALVDPTGGLAAERTAFLRKLRAMQAAIDAVAACRKPVAAAISGWCIGGGVDLIAACDVRYASADARFSIREVKVAIVADLGSLQRLPAIIGDGHLRELALTGRDIDATRAARIGLVNDVLSTRPDAITAAHTFADEVAANPPLVVHGIKDVLDAERQGRVSAGLRYVGAWNAAFLPSRDLAEARDAFLERRPPQFRGQ